MPEEVAASCVRDYRKSEVYKKGPINDNRGSLASSLGTEREYLKIRTTLFWVIRQEKLFHVLFKSIPPSKFLPTPSSQAIDKKGFDSPNRRCLWSPLDMTKPSQPFFPHLVDDGFDLKFCSKNSVRIQNKQFLGPEYLVINERPPHKEEEEERNATKKSEVPKS
nr:hypothetical protein [Tanacetum cinerariifolium]